MNEKNQVAQLLEELEKFLLDHKEKDLDPRSLEKLLPVYKKTWESESLYLAIKVTGLNIESSKWAEQIVTQFQDIGYLETYKLVKEKADESKHLLEKRREGWEIRVFVYEIMSYFKNDIFLNECTEVIETINDSIGNTPGEFYITLQKASIIEDIPALEIFVHNLVASFEREAELRGE